MNKKISAFLQIVVVLIICVGLLLFVKQDDNQSEDIKSTKAYPKKKPASIEGKLSIYKPEKVSDGFTLYPISGPELIKLLNIEGEVVHKWTGIDADRARLLPNCNLLVLHGSKLNINKKPWSDLIRRVSEYDWEGNLVWSYTSDYHIHHDTYRTAEGNTILLLKVPIPSEEKNKITDSFRKKFEIIADVLIEIDSQGKILWKWKSWEHLDLNDCGVNKCLGFKDKPLNRRQRADIADWTHMNTLSVIPDNKWFQEGDDRFRPGNIVLLARNFWEIMILDRDSGEVVWRYNGDYKGGMVRGHEAFMIEEGLPGAGNILVLDNGFDGIREETYILEINPVSNEIVWVYDAGKDFYTRARGSVQRLPNGNTLISEDRNARAFEVTSEGEIVWEYKAGKLIVRPQRYQQDYCERLEELPLR